MEDSEYHTTNYVLVRAAYSPLYCSRVLFVTAVCSTQSVSRSEMENMHLVYVYRISETLSQKPLHLLPCHYLKQE